MSEADTSGLGSVFMGSCKGARQLFRNRKNENILIQQFRNATFDVGQIRVRSEISCRNAKDPLEIWPLAIANHWSGSASITPDKNTQRSTKTLQLAVGKLLEKPAAQNFRVTTGDPFSLYQSSKKKA